MNLNPEFFELGYAVRLTPEQANAIAQMIRTHDYFKEKIMTAQQYCQDNNIGRIGDSVIDSLIESHKRLSKNA